MTDPGASVPRSAATLPGGGGSGVQSAPGGSVGEQVPIYGTNQLSSPGLANSINQSEERSSGTACDGQGQRSTTTGGSASTTTGDCPTSDNALGTPSIMGGSGSTSGAVDVSGR